MARFKNGHEFNGADSNWTRVTKVLLGKNLAFTYTKKDRHACIVCTLLSFFCQRERSERILRKREQKQYKYADISYFQLFHCLQHLRKPKEGNFEVSWITEKKAFKFIIWNHPYITYSTIFAF
jgi:hypothetical protein